MSRDRRLLMTLAAVAFTLLSGKTAGSCDDPPVAAFAEDTLSVADSGATWEQKIDAEVAGNMDFWTGGPRTLTVSIQLSIGAECKAGATCSSRTGTINVQLVNDQGTPSEEVFSYNLDLEPARSVALTSELAITDCTENCSRQFRVRVTHDRADQISNSVQGTVSGALRCDTCTEPPASASLSFSRIE